MKYDERDVLLIGGGGSAKVVIDCFYSSNSDLRLIGILDSDTAKLNSTLLGVPFIGTDDELEKLYSRGVRKAFISLGTVGNYKPRLYLYNKLKSLGYTLVNIIHPNAIISKHITLGEGNVIMPGAIINVNANIGNNCIINSGSIIEHDTVICNNVHIAPGVRIAGNVTVGENSMIGIGSTIIQGIKIGSNVLVGANSTVIRDIDSDVIAVGCPAKIIRKRD